MLTLGAAMFDLKLHMGLPLVRFPSRYLTRLHPMGPDKLDLGPLGAEAHATVIRYCVSLWIVCYLFVF